MTTALTIARVCSLLPLRPADAHKYTFGRVLVIAGSVTCPGAASLATAAAARVGAGLVVLGVGRSAQHGPGRIPEVVLQILPEAEWGYLGEAAADEVRQHLTGTAALLIGLGIGRDETTRQFVCRLLGVSRAEERPLGFATGTLPPEPPATALPPLVVDADALTLLAEVEGWWQHLPANSAVLTPHAGEMARLLGVPALAGDHQLIATNAAKRWRQVVVLKGATTVIADPTGQCVHLTAPNPALATAGTGDVLAGCIVGLMAQGLAPFAAALAGVFIHAQAGADVAREIGDAGALASDLLPRLPLVIKALRNNR
ncbi:MAG TPA: NAD(P)H-hydrate dehydratase [Planctomycetota bacterium]|nr:NAD(P)H-hydrate dehydratase [Planctomycetota bacterium]